jgi:hypothetical protein
LTACTGPKSAAGKAKSALNARRHGLNVSIGADRELVAQAEALAQWIAGANPSAELVTLARAIADAQIELVRVRQAASNLLDGSEPGQCERLPDPTNPRDDDAHLLHQFEALDRYERRVLSRRNRAVQDFDCQRLIESVTS